MKCTFYSGTCYMYTTKLFHHYMNLDYYISNIRCDIKSLKPDN